MEDQTHVSLYSIEILDYIHLDLDSTILISRKRDKISQPTVEVSRECSSMHPSSIQNK